MSVHFCSALLDQLNRLDQTAVRVVVIAITASRGDLHPLLLQSRGYHVFEEVLEIQPPDLVSPSITPALQLHSVIP